MKRYSFFRHKGVLATLFLLVALLSASCSRNSDEPNQQVQQDKLENIAITPQLINTITNTSVSKWKQLVGDKIFLANPSNLAGGIAQYMKKYDLSTNATSNVTPDASVCACGLGNQFISDGTNIFYIANEAKKYTVSSNTWSSLNYPAAFKDGNGETGMTFYNGKIYVAGTRTASKKFRFYNTGTDGWENLPDYNNNVSQAELIGANNKIYLLGGISANTSRNFSYFDISSGSWTDLPDVPFDVYSASSDNLLAQTKNRFIFFLDYNKTSIHIFDTQTQVWRIDALKLNNTSMSIWYDAGLFTYDDNTLYIVGSESGNSKNTKIFKLNITY